MIRRRILLATAAISAFLLHNGTAFGQWTADGVAISRAAGLQASPIIVSDGAAGAVVVWLDMRHAVREIYARGVTSGGGIPPGWESDGTPITTAGGDPTGYVAVPDGAGGVVVAWLDTRDVPGGRIYAQHLTASGSIAPGWTEGGVQVSTSSSGRDVTPPAIVSDGQGGAIVIYGSYYVICDTKGHCRSIQPQLLAERVNSSGVIEPPWSNGEVVLDPAGTPAAAAVADGAGGAIVGWIAHAAGGDEIRLERVTSAAVIAAGWPSDGLALGTTPCSKIGLRMASDGRGGAILVWSCFEAGTSWDVRGVRVTAAGTVSAGWAAGGVPVCAAVGNQVAADLVPDGAHGAIVFWQDGRAAVAHIFALHLTETGAPAAGWPVDGEALSSAAGDQSTPQGASDGFGGAYVAWSDLRSGGSADLYAQHVAPDGALAEGWPGDGMQVCTAPLQQIQPVAASDGAGGAIVAWQDGRAALLCGGASCDDIYAQRLVTDGPVPALAAVISSDAEPGGVRLVWEIGGPTVARVGIERAESAGGWTRVGTASPDGNGRVEFEDRDVASGRRYGYRLVFDHRALGGVAGEVWISVPGSPPLALFRPKPHPISGEWSATLSLPGPGKAALEVIDINGRRLRILDVGDLGPGRHTIDLGPVSKIPAGVYLLRLTRGSAVLTTRAVVVH